jgi:hypothetical protein
LFRLRLADHQRMVNNPLPDHDYASTRDTQVQNDSGGYGNFIIPGLINNMENEPIKKKTEDFVLHRPASPIDSPIFPRLGIAATSRQLF